MTGGYVVSESTSAILSISALRHAQQQTHKERTRDPKLEMGVRHGNERLERASDCKNHEQTQGISKPHSCRRRITGTLHSSVSCELKELSVVRHLGQSYVGVGTLRGRISHVLGVAEGLLTASEPPEPDGPLPVLSSEEFIVDESGQ